MTTSKVELIDNGEAAIKAIKILSAEGTEQLDRHLNPGIPAKGPDIRAARDSLRRIHNICRLLEDVAAQPKECSWCGQSGGNCCEAWDADHDC